MLADNTPTKSKRKKNRKSCAKPSDKRVNVVADFLVRIDHGDEWGLAQLDPTFQAHYLHYARAIIAALGKMEGANG